MSQAVLRRLIHMLIIWFLSHITQVRQLLWMYLEMMWRCWPSTGGIQGPNFDSGCYDGEPAPYSGNPTKTCLKLTSVKEGLGYFFMGPIRKYHP